MDKLQGKPPLSWDPIVGGRIGRVCFVDDKLYDLGPDPSHRRFETIASKMLSGNYYPPDAVVFSGEFRSERRGLKVGDRVLQQAPLFGKLGGPNASSQVEIFAAERGPDHCKIGYVTTVKHHGRGKWCAQLSWREGRLSLHVESTAMPNSLLFWLGLPYARYLQVRARERAVEEFRKTTS